ncbi:uncharacterized protein LOC116266379 isoform X2 [Nymphaea colorata]|uniref:uncharacterized protein LOC116266379 isoform X2 n=1 Tax=Nymphaea colorata TaxID=210225 RepID=UPI00129E87DE|nr:uncharacterized protein LOC116266379 isoform X2 [Nymphaea colorata]
MDGRSFSCETAAGTLAWINSIAGFLRSYKWLTDAHLVNFFQDRLWEEMDHEWLDCLRDEPVESLLRIPSGFVKGNWPVSLQEFVATARSLALPRERKNWQTALAFNFQPLDSVLSQGMNMKKKHEVEILSAVIKTIADDIGARTVIDVGAGQGYLAQVLSFQCKLPVVALDASPHHGTVTSSRAARIRKHYLSQAQKLNGSRNLNVPKTVTCNVLSSNVLTSFSATLCEEVDTLVENSGNDHGILSHKTSQKNASTSRHESMNPSLLLAGLHACGNLSVNMLRTFLDCEEVKAVVSIGCCYNLLSEEQSTGDEQQCGFPLSHGVKSSGLILGKNARDLACQSAERWASLTSEVACQNFDVHAFRAAFQVALYKHHPDIVERSLSIGRQGKALRRRQLGKALQSQLILRREGVSDATDIASLNKDKDFECAKVEEVKEHFEQEHANELRGRCKQSAHESDSHSIYRNNRYPLFEDFCNSGLSRLGLGPSNIDVYSIWREALPYCELIGPYWSLRAALGPLVETLILLDRLLFLQEQEHVFSAHQQGRGWLSAQTQTLRGSEIW